MNVQKIVLVTGSFYKHCNLYDVLSKYSRYVFMHEGIQLRTISDRLNEYNFLVHFLQIIRIKKLSVKSKSKLNRVIGSTTFKKYTEFTNSKRFVNNYIFIPLR